MKKLMLPICFIGVLAACKKDEVEVQETTMRVNYYTQTCQGVGEQQCYLVQKNDQIGSNDWSLFYNEIEGFQYEEGFFYTLQVRIEQVENPPADGSSLKYILVKILSKEEAS